VAIVLGALLSYWVTSNRDLAVASGVAFLFSELAAFADYQPLRERRWLVAVAASNQVRLVIDSVLFLQIAFGSLDFIQGQIIGKIWTTIVAVLVLLALRRWVIPRYSRPADEPPCHRSRRPSAAGAPVLPGKAGAPAGRVTR
jgi:queuosine precursor transporter